MTYDLIIFDCDGTLVDSEHMNMLAVAALFESLGLPQYTPSVIGERFTGMNFDVIVRLVEDENNTKLPADMNQRFVDFVARFAPAYLKATASAEDLVDFVRHHAKICMASNGERDNIFASLKMTGLDRFFSEDNVFYGAMVEHPKPAPDLFWLAAEKKDAAPEKTLVIEDSVTGVTAGKAAGMTVFGFVGTAHDKPGQTASLQKAGADKIYDSLGDIRDDLAVDFIPERAGLTG